MMIRSVRLMDSLCASSSRSFVRPAAAATAAAALDSFGGGGSSICCDDPSSRNITNRLSLSPTTLNQLPGGPQRSFHTSAVSWAGHNKWSNIKDTKMANDAAKGRLFGDLVKEIGKACKALNNADPILNPQLAKVIKLCQINNMKKETIDRAIDRFKNAKTMMNQNFVKGPGGGYVAMNVDAEPGKGAKFVRKVIKELPMFSLITKEPEYVFERKACVLTARNYEKTETKKKKSSAFEDEIEQLGEELSFDRIQEIAIEVEAEEVLEIEDDNGRQSFQVICDPAQVDRIEKDIKKAGVYVRDSYPCFLPTVQIHLSEEDLKAYGELMQNRYEVEEIQQVFTNVSPISKEELAAGKQHASA